MIPKFKKAAGLLLSLALSFFAPHIVTSGALDSWYTDVPDHSVYYDGIFYMTQAELVTGYDDGTFLPDREVSRVEALKMILEYSAVEDSTTLELKFSDTDPDAWYNNYLSTALGLGIISGYPDGTFLPENTVNRVEALKMLLLATDRSLPEATDENWYSAYLNYAAQNAVLIPDANGNYLPGQALTRGELADLLYRFEKSPYTTQVEYGIGSYYGRSFDGHNTASGTALDTDGFMCAHKTLPFGTVVRVTNLANKQSVDLTVVDRGPYTDGYIVDLTPTAFEQIGSLSTGILNVRLEVLK